MSSSYKPENYNSLSPYLVVDGAQELVNQLKTIFDLRELRIYDREDGKILHAEFLLDDSVIMLADSTDQYPATTSLLHLYVPDVHKTFRQAIENGCEIISEPTSHEGDPDMRGSFYDQAGNIWSVSTQNVS